MGLNIRQGVTVSSEDGGMDGGEDWVQRLSAIMFDEVQAAQIGIQSRWPIDTGRSFQSWTVSQPQDLTVILRNDARDNKGEYAGYVRRSGESVRIAEDARNPGGVRYEAFKAQDRIQSRIVSGTLPEEDPTFAINRLLVARMTRELARGNAQAARAIRVT